MSSAPGLEFARSPDNTAEPLRLREGLRASDTAGIPAWERIARAALEQRGQGEALVIVDPALTTSLSTPPAGATFELFPEANGQDDAAFFRGQLSGLVDEDSLLPFFVPPPVVAPAASRLEHARVEGAPAPPPPWFERFFDTDFLAFEPQASDRLTERETDFIVASFGLSEGARILDLACGTGRHANELARRGYQVVGLDLSKPLLEHAATASRARKLSVDFVHGDMRSLAFRRLFDAVLLWGTSFGYFRDAENLLVLRKIAQAMRPGGRLLLELANRDFVLRDVPRAWWRREAGGLLFDEIDFEWRTSRYKFRRQILRADGKERVDTLDFRAYSLSELLALLSAEGFVPLEISGRISTRGAFFGAESPSILLLAEIR